MSLATVTKKTLKVPGAEIYYEVSGSGPVLLFMPGGPADARAFESLREHLVDNYTVVTYDPRGLSRSTLVEPLDEKRIIQVFADDVRRLIEATTDQPAYVFASSGGATISLELVAKYGSQLKAVVPHEPPSPTLQPNPKEIRDGMDDVVATYRAAGLYPAAQKFAAQARIKGGPPPAPQGEPTAEQREAMEQMQRNMNLFFGPYIAAIAHYEPDIRALRQAPCRIIPAVGTNSRGELAHDGGLYLAKFLGTEATIFPGAHGGFEEQPREFAAKLIEVLGSSDL